MGVLNIHTTLPMHTPKPYVVSTPRLGPTMSWTGLAFVGGNGPPILVCRKTIFANA